MVGGMAFAVATNYGPDGINSEKIAALKAVVSDASIEDVSPSADPEGAVALAPEDLSLPDRVEHYFGVASFAVASGWAKLIGKEPVEKDAYKMSCTRKSGKKICNIIRD